MNFIHNVDYRYLLEAPRLDINFQNTLIGNLFKRNFNTSANFISSSTLSISMSEKAKPRSSFMNSSFLKTMQNLEIDEGCWSTCVKPLHSLVATTVNVYMSDRASLELPIVSPPVEFPNSWRPRETTHVAVGQHPVVLDACRLGTLAK